MPLTLNLSPDAQARLRRRAEQSGVTAEEAAREVRQAAEQPPASVWGVLGMILILMLLPHMPRDPELEAKIAESFQPYVDHLLAHGTEEELAMLLPKMPLEEKFFYETATPEEWSREFLAWAESHRELPTLPPCAFSREADYEDRD